MTTELCILYIKGKRKCVSALLPCATVTVGEVGSKLSLLSSLYCYSFLVSDRRSHIKLDLPDYQAWTFIASVCPTKPKWLEVE